MFGDLVLYTRDKRITLVVTHIVTICVRGILVIQSFESRLSLQITIL